MHVEHYDGCITKELKAVLGRSQYVLFIVFGYRGDPAKSERIVLSSANQIERKIFFFRSILNYSGRAPTFDFFRFSFYFS